jgi:hypothetical protein
MSAASYTGRMPLRSRIRSAGRGLAAALAMGLLGAAAAPALGSMVLALGLPELTARSERIVVAEVTGVRSGWDRRHERILSTIDVKVAEVWKGQVPADGHLTLVQPGGAADGIEMRVHGLPYFAAGERAVLFLRGSAAQPLALVGMGQGKRGLTYEPVSKRWMVDGGDRSAAVIMDQSGKAQSPPPVASLPLDELRRQVRALMVTKP